MRSGRMYAWYQASRPPFFIATLVPLALGGALAWKDGGWNAPRWIIALTASFLVHLATNLANDYFEYESGADDGDAIGGSRVLQEGHLSSGQIRNAMIILYAAACALGVWLVSVSHAWYLGTVMPFAFCSSLFYTAPPVRYGYHGLGELMVGINMGPVMVAGTYTALSGYYSLVPVLISIPVALMVALILYFQSLPDIHTDASIGKRTLAVRIGRAHAVTGYRALALAAIISIVLLVASGLVHPLAMLSLSTILPAAAVDRMIRETPVWRDLHGRGGVIRLFYLANGIIVIVSTLLR